jgi:serine/threonine protein kinase
VLSNDGYDGSAADIWSCGVILYVLMAGCLPFEESDLATLYDKVLASYYCDGIDDLISPPNLTFWKLTYGCSQI